MIRFVNFRRMTAWFLVGTFASLTGAAERRTTLEIKADGDSLTVTTTPELQRAIRTLVGLMQGKAPTSAAPAPSHRDAILFHDGGVKYLAEPVKLDGAAIKTWTDALKTTPALLKFSAEPIKLNDSIKVEDAAKLNFFFHKPDPPAEVKPAKPPEQ